MTSIIRPATAIDVPSLLPMVAKICAMHGAMDPDKYSFLPRIDERYRAWLTQRASDPRSVLLVADIAGKIGGFVVGTIDAEIPIYTLKEFGFIHDLWVELQHRRSGIGRQLALAAVERFRAMGVAQVRLDTASANEPARRMFASCGFRACTVEMLLATNETDQRMIS